MKKSFALLAWLFYATMAMAQDGNDFTLHLRSGAYIPVVSQPKIDPTDPAIKAKSFNNTFYAVLQFAQIPAEAEKATLKNLGVELLEYIPSRAYRVAITRTIDPAFYNTYKIRTLVELSPVQKMDTRLVTKNFPAWTTNIAGKVEVTVSFPSAISPADLTAALNTVGAVVINDKWSQYRLLTVRISPEKLLSLAALPCIDYVEPAKAPDQSLNYISGASHRSHVLNAAATVGGRNLSGNGVVVGVGDEGGIMTHNDIIDRVIDRCGENYAFHASHVTGIVGGGGLLNPLFKGHAHKATILSQSYSNILDNAPAYVQDNGMVITNNSYGNVVGNCSVAGTYDLYARAMDLQAQQLPFLLNIFAAGNDGGLSCGGYPTGYATTIGGFQSAKNVLTVGATNTDGSASIYAKGPVKDGRVKPEITAIGQGVISTAPFNNYAGNSGTSMATPQVAGTLALLWERYRQLNGGANPKAALMKAIVCNTASDRGNAGPDFAFGFGWLNGLRAVQVIENNQFFTQTISNGQTLTHNITIPANSGQLKVMLYWPDAPAAAFAASTLVNDIDLSVMDPSSAFVLPLTLNATPTGVLNPATNGADHRNNMEQVIINNPAAGNYTISLNGFNIPQGPQEYFVVYELVPDALQLTYPIGDESWVAGETETIQWESFQSPGIFTLEFSTDNGASWSPLGTTAGSNRRFTTTVPAGNTSQARIRISNGAQVSTGNAFTILGVPGSLLASSPCEGALQLNWASVTGATDYEVFMKQGAEMVAQGTTTGNSLLIKNLDKNLPYWLSVRARLNGRPGRRAIAVSAQPNGTACTLPDFDNDLKAEALVAPVSGRALTSTALSAATPIRARIKNLDDAASTGSFDISYRINAGPTVTETIAPNIAAGGSYDHSFTTPADFSTPGTYNITISVSRAGDANAGNNTVTQTIKSIANDPVTLPFNDGFETTAQKDYQFNYPGLDGDERWDFNSNIPRGRARTFVNSSFARNGNRAITLDALNFGSAAQNDLIGNFNLAAYAGNDNVRLDFHYKHHGQEPVGANKLFIRGSDTSPWIDAYDLFNNQEDAGNFNWVKSIDLSLFFSSFGQSFSSSTQIRFIQSGASAAGDNLNTDGYTFDDIQIYTVTDDIQLQRVVTPLVSNCGGSAAAPVTVTVRNSSTAAISNIPISFRLNNGTIVTETIPVIAGRTAINYTFTNTIDVSAPGLKLLDVWTSLATDSYRPNDSIVQFKFFISPVITSFPYLEGFESNDGFWFTGGKINTWEYGTIASGKLKTAANGSRGWKTTLAGNYKDREQSYLYSPCFNITGMTAPTLSFSHAYDLETDFDYGWVEYSTDGITWQKLGAPGSGTNWYNSTAANAWTDEKSNWHVATYALPVVSGTIRLRIAMQSDLYVNLEGMGIDDVHVYDNLTPVYDGPTLSAPITQAVSGNGWIDFKSGTQLVASIHPQGQNLGSTSIQTFIHTGAVRNANNQYYHNRNWTIQPTNAPTGNVRVRLYFLETETNALLQATGCVTCSKPRSAYDLGVTKYSGPLVLENGDLADNTLTGYSFILPADVAIIPFDKGYYAEFEVSSFSEFWLNHGGPALLPLPLQLNNFTAQKTANKQDALLQWTTSNEVQTQNFDVQVALNETAMRQGRFETLATLAARGGNNSYRFTDASPGKNSIRYYRLKMNDRDGRFTYSEIRALTFTNEVQAIIYPNPGNGLYQVLLPTEPGQQLSLQITDLAGRQVWTKTFTVNTFSQKIVADISDTRFAAGIYTLQINTDGQIFSQKIVKN